MTKTPKSKAGASAPGALSLGGKSAVAVARLRILLR